jgi:hypothetical protein
MRGQVGRDVAISSDKERTCGRLRLGGVKSPQSLVSRSIRNATQKRVSARPPCSANGFSGLLVFMPASA